MKISIMRFKETISKEVIITIPWTTVKSLWVIASYNRKAIPGHEKVTSNSRAPPANDAIVKPEIVNIGKSAFGNAWLKIIFSCFIIMERIA